MHGQERSYSLARGKQFGLLVGQMLDTCLGFWQSALSKHHHVHSAGSPLTGSIWDQGWMVTQPSGQEGWDENP